MPTIERNDQPEDHAKDEKGSPSSEESISSKVETRQIKQSGKIAAKKKTARKKAAKKAGDRMVSAEKKASPTRRKEVQREESDSSKTETMQLKQSRKAAAKKKTARKKAAKKAGDRMDSAKKKASPTRHKETQPEKPVEGSVSPAAAPPLHSQPQPRGGTGLMGFWIKAGASVFVILAGVIGIYTFFSEDETASRPEAAGAQGDNASVAGRVAADTGTARGDVFPPATQQSSVVDPESSHGYKNEPGMFAGAAVTNEPVVGSAITAGVTPGVAPAADQPHAGQSDAAPEPAGYRPELYRPLEPEQDPPPSTQASAINETPRASFVPAPYYYPQPGAYAYPPASYYGGYGRYYPY
jgi:hypothetical protein